MANFNNYLKNISQKIFADLKTNEEVSLFLHSEESQFIRFNQSKVRQNTTVHQHELSVHFQNDHRQIKFTLNLTLDESTDLQNLLSELQVSRTQLALTDPHPQYFPMVNNGTSEHVTKVDRPNDHEMLQIITEAFKGTDMAGLFCSGPVRQASINSKGQYHFFESDFFFLDYSIYNGPKAAKGFFSTDKWDVQKLKQNIEQTKNKLNLLNQPTISVPKGQYRVYLEPMALQDILWTMSWGGFSCAAMHQGRSALKKLFQKEVQLSEKVTITENLGLGYVPMFNNLGEVGEKEITLVKKGQLEQLLTSTASAQEYKVPSNKAHSHEIFRSPEIKPGSLTADDVLKKLGTGLYLSNLHYLNWSDQQSARLTGMTRFACFWVENGQIKGPIQDLRFDDSVYNLLGSNLIDLTTHQELFVDSSTYQKRSLGAGKFPGALIENFNFTL